MQVHILGQRTKVQVYIPVQRIEIQVHIPVQRTGVQVHILGQRTEVKVYMPVKRTRTRIAITSLNRVDVVQILFFSLNLQTKQLVEPVVCGSTTSHYSSILSLQRYNLSSLETILLKYKDK